MQEACRGPLAANLQRYRELTAARRREFVEQPPAPSSPTGRKATVKKRKEDPNRIQRKPGNDPEKAAASRRVAPRPSRPHALPRCTMHAEAAPKQMRGKTRLLASRLEATCLTMWGRHVRVALCHSKQRPRCDFGCGWLRLITMTSPASLAKPRRNQDDWHQGL
jgi:hypothetical protein